MTRQQRRVRVCEAQTLAGVWEDCTKCRGHGTVRDGTEPFGVQCDECGGKGVTLIDPMFCDCVACANGHPKECLFLPPPDDETPPRQTKNRERA